MSNLISRAAAVLLVIGIVGEVHAQSPCDGMITDKLAHNMTAGAVAKPTAGATYVDPVFGSRITRISNADPAEGTLAIIKTLYNGTRGWNSNESQIIAWDRDAGRKYRFYQGDTPYALLGTILLPNTDSLNTYPSDIEHIMWSTEDPNVLYYTGWSGSGNSARLMKITLNWPSAPSYSVQRDFTTECTAAGLGANNISFGHMQDMSYDGHEKVGLRCGYDENFLMMLYDISTDTILGTYRSSAQSPAWPFVSGGGAYMSETGKILNTALEQVGQVTLGGYLEHSTMGYSIAQGYDSHMLSDFDTPGKTGNLVTYRMDQAAPTGTVIIGQSLGWPYTITNSHPSMSALNGSGWVAVGMGGDGTGQGVLNGEIALANIATGAVCRIAHTRSEEGNQGGFWGYWAESHPQISGDGYRVLFNSDWENSSTVDLYVVDLRPMTTTVLTTTLPNGVKDEAYSRALSATGSTPPYTWTKTVGSWPTGISMNGSGVISGTPTVVEAQTVTVQACDSSGTPVCDTQQLTLTIQQRPTIVESSPLASHTVGSAYAVNFTATGGTSPYAWSLASGTLCVGLTLGSDGSLSGTPTTLETCTFTVRATDSHAQPISQTKQFELTIALPSACLPGGSSVCMRTFPSAEKVFVRYGQVGLPSNSTCTATLKLNGSTVDTIQTTSGFAKRPTLFTGLTPSTLYTIEVSCTGLGDMAASVVTTAASGGTYTVNSAFAPNAILPTATQVTLEYGTAAVTENSSTNSSCGTSCTVSLSLAQDIYLMRHTWKTAGGATLAQSDIRYQTVP